VNSPQVSCRLGTLVGRTFGLSVTRWVLLLTVSGVAGWILSSYFVGDDMWAAFACALGVAIFVHLCLVADRYVAFPSLISLVASIELLLAPVIAHAFPPSFFQFRMTVPFDRYLQYAIPATAALWIGLHWPLNRAMMTRLNFAPPAPLRSEQRIWLDIVLVVSLLLSNFVGFFPAGLVFFVRILGSFSFFAALCWMLSRTPGWKLRAVIVMVQLMATASADGIFYLVVQWGGFFLLIYGFYARWRRRMAMALIVAIVGAVILQYVKSDYRRYLGTLDASFVERVSTLGGMAWNTVAAKDNEANSLTFGDVLARFDQGWIVSRIMNMVPRKVPYAQGETVKDAFLFALLPRVFFPDKPGGVSHALFSRYTGLQLSPTTSMGLSIPGEMYANFGYWGGILGTLVFGSLVGLAYARFAKLASKSAYWWAAAPIVLLAAIEPAWNLEDISNYIVKSALVLILLASVVPALRDLLALEPIWRHKKLPMPLPDLRERYRFDPHKMQ
jgi:hypothetical protein